jgi:3-oxoacyl-[acyl-carrier protein] reductase
MPNVGGPLAGKTAIITGAGRGIGRAIAIGYAKAGAAVCCAARTERELEKTVAKITADGGKAIAIPTDVTVNSQVESLMKTANRRLGAIHILVINAGGFFDRGELAESDPAIWRRSLDLNLFGAYLCARAAIPYLKKSGAGKIITVGSGLGHNGRAGGSAYACAKAGLWMLARVLAQELLASNISVNELIPGPVRMDNSTGRLREKRKKLAKGEWLKNPEDVVPLALFLAAQLDTGPTAQSFSLMRRDG